MKCEIRHPETFLYFAYGANIWACRMHMHSPSAHFISIARADNYRLDFHRYNKFWGGPEATMVPTANAHVWGVIWKVNHEDKISFDDHKGMNMKKYYLKYIDVLTPYKGYIHCAVYIQRINPLPMGDNDPIPVERWPSWTYREVMVYGAKEHGLPPFYIEFLQNLKNNGEEGCLRVFCLCVRYGRDDPCLCWVPGRIPRQPLKLEWRQIRAFREMKRLAEEREKLAEEQRLADEKKRLAEEKEKEEEQKKEAEQEKKPAVEEKKPAVEEKKPAVEETQPAVEETQPAAEEQEPAAE